MSTRGGTPPWATLLVTPDHRGPGPAFCRSGRPVRDPEATAFHDTHGDTTRRVPADIADHHKISRNWIAVCSALQSKWRSSKPPCPWTNGKAEQFHRTPQTEWAYSHSRICHH